MAQSFSPSRLLPLVLVLLFLGLSVLFSGLEWPHLALWPTAVALVLVLLFRRVVLGLLSGALGGAILLADGNLFAAIGQLFSEHLFPSFGSTWKVGALLFTLLLGGFAAMIEAGGGLRKLVGHWLQRGRDPRRDLQVSTFGLGFICFFDGLANAMLLGRVTRSMADQAGVARVKMAYLVDSTSSAVACIAFISTWIGFQLSLIATELEAAGLAGSYSPYSIFFASVPLNFYCLLTLLLLLGVILRNWNIGPMRRFEQQAVPGQPDGRAGLERAAEAPVFTALLPLFALVAAIIGAFSVIGFAEASGAEEAGVIEQVIAGFSSSWGPYVLVGGSLVGIAVAAYVFPRPALGQRGPASAFFDGFRALLLPALILISAWVIGSVIDDLGAAEFLVSTLGEELNPAYLPVLIFLVGALISFSTGTSWGTMGILMPLALPFVFAVDAEAMAISESVLISAIVAAVFSGAVFGDHCSPFSDTTIVSSIACGVEPVDHVKTQLPYALIAATVAAVFGFIPLGFGWTTPLYALMPGVLVILALLLWPRGKQADG